MKVDTKKRQHIEAKPLAVDWLCKDCHARQHRQFDAPTDPRQLEIFGSEDLE